jgi:NADH-quinone oxidoreductase subunit M
MGALGLFFAMASLGLPGLGNFVAEILVLIGVYKVSIALTVLATIGLVAATIYSLWLVHRTFHGPNERKWSLPDINRREALVLWVLVIGLVGLGLYPQPVLDAAEPALAHVLEPFKNR